MATTKKTTEKKPAAKKATTAKKPAAKKVVKKVEQAPLHIGLVEHDSWLEPFENAIPSVAVTTMPCGKSAS